MKSSIARLKPIALLLCAAVPVLAACRKARNAPAISPEREVRVVATIFPVYDIMREAGGIRASVSLLVPPGAEAHSFEPRPSDAVKSASVQVFAYAGDSMEPWARKFAAGLDSSGLLIADLSRGVRLRAPASGAGSDPHIWLDFANAAAMAENAARALSAVDPPNKDYYYSNLAGIKRRLAKLDAEYKTGLASCRSRAVIYAGHFSFGYLAARYGLEYHALGDAGPDAEPSAGRVAGLARAARAAGAKTVFAEEMSSPKFAQAIASEIGAQVETLNPMHEITRSDFDSGEDYYSIMEDNLRALSKGLGCAKP